MNGVVCGEWRVGAMGKEIFPESLKARARRPPCSVLLVQILESMSPCSYTIVLLYNLPPAHEGSGINHLR